MVTLRRREDRGAEEMKMGKDGGMEVYREPKDPKGEGKWVSREYEEEEEAKRRRLLPPED